MLRYVPYLSTPPGAIAITRTHHIRLFALRFAASASELPLWRRHKQEKPCETCLPAVEAIVMIDPRRREIMPGRNAFKVRKVPVRLTSSVSRQTSRDSSVANIGLPFPPARVIRISVGPNCVSASSRNVSKDAKSVTSAGTAIVFPPFATSAFATFPMFSAFRA